jgi:hypothetical protein
MGAPMAAPFLITPLPPMRNGMDNILLALGELLLENLDYLVQSGSTELQDNYHDEFLGDIGITSSCPLRTKFCLDKSKIRCKMVRTTIA